VTWWLMHASAPQSWTALCAAWMGVSLVWLVVVRGANQGATPVPQGSR